MRLAQHLPQQRCQTTPTFRAALLAVASCGLACTAAHAGWGDTFDGARYALFSPQSYDGTGNSPTGTLNVSIAGCCGDNYVAVSHQRAANNDGAAFALNYASPLLTNVCVRANINPTLSSNFVGTPFVAFRYTPNTGKGWFAAIDWTTGQLQFLRRTNRFSSMTTLATANATGFAANKEYRIEVLSQSDRTRINMIDVAAGTTVASIDSTSFAGDIGVAGYGIFTTASTATPVFATFDDVLAAPLARRTDCTGDGRSDIAWRNLSNGRVGRWAMQGLASFSYQDLGVVADANWFVRATGDFDMDGESDLYWHNILTGEVIVWLLRGGNYYNWIPLPSAPAGWELSGVADLNADGTNDIVWRNPTTGSNGIWIMNGQSILRWQGLTSVTDPAWKLVSAADLNLDGKSDLVWQNTSTGLVAAWLMNGASITSFVPMGNAFGYTLVGAADFDEDEVDVDFLWQNDATGQIGAWVMSGLSVAAWQPFAALPPTVWVGSN
jgi:hypothetical protein